MVQPRWRPGALVVVILDCLSGFRNGPNGPWPTGSGISTLASVGEGDETAGHGRELPYAEVAGVAFAAQSEVSLTAARAVRPVIERVWVNVVAAGPTPDWALRAAGQKIAADPWARRQLAGHLFEQLDTQRYNLRHLADPASVRRVLRLCDQPLARGYDAYRFIGGKFAGGVQHKMCAANIRAGVNRLDAVTPGSGRLVTFRVPSDVADQASRTAGNRVQASEFSRADVYGQLDRGAEALARDGSMATSRAFQTAKAGAKGAGVAVVVGGLLDARKLRRREMQGKHFLARRGVDAAEGAVTTVATSGAVAATMSIATTVVAAGGTGTVTATAVLTAPAWAPPLALGLVIGTGVGFVGRRVRRRVDGRFTAASVSEIESPSGSILVEDLDAHRPRPWLPAAAAMLVVPTVSLWTPNSFALWRPSIGGGW